jgi:hypothetical protein
MGVSPMKEFRNKEAEILGPADENVGNSRAGRPCHLRAIPSLKQQSHHSPDNENFLRKTDRAFHPAIVAESHSTPAAFAGDSTMRFP